VPLSLSLFLVFGMSAARQQVQFGPSSRVLHQAAMEALTGHLSLPLLLPSTI
jgi:hypothetical protein